ASISTLHALAAAREAAIDGVRARGLAGRSDLRPPRVYCSEHAHSSVDKAVILLGLGHEALRRVPADSEFRMRADALADAIDDDRRAGRQPIAVVATVGTTSTTSVDPIEAIAGVCARERLWLHVDAAYAGVAAMVLRHFGAGGVRAHLAEHMRLARLFASWVDASARFERVAPVPFSVVCFRLRADDDANARVLERVNASGDVFISHTKLDGRYVLRLAIGNLATTERHVARAWELLNQA